MSRRYRFIIAGAVVAVLVAIGGIAVAESGGQSGDHRQNPTTTTGEPAPTQPTVTVAPKVPGPEDGVENEGEGDPAAPWGLCHVARFAGSDKGVAMKNEHGVAFQRCDNASEPQASGDEGDGGGEPQGQGQGGPPENPGNGNGNGGGGNPHAAAAPGRNR